MSFYDLASELLIVVAEHLESEKDISSLAQVDRRTAQAIIPYLYRHNIHHSESTALHWAAEHGQTGTLQHLINQGVNLNLTNGSFCTALFLATIFRRFDIVELLLDAGADPFAPVRGGSPLHYAAGTGDTTMVNRLLAKGVDASGRDKTGGTAVHSAVRANRYGMVRFLLDAGVDPDAEDNVGDTPLHVAATWGRREIAGLLLQRGADPIRTNVEGEMPLHLAVLNKKDDMVRFFVEIKAIPTMEYSQGISLRLSVSYYGHTTVVDLLQRPS